MELAYKTWSYPPVNAVGHAVPNGTTIKGLREKSIAWISERPYNLINTCHYFGEFLDKETGGKTHAPTTLTKVTKAVAKSIEGARSYIVDLKNELPTIGTQQYRMPNVGSQSFSPNVVNWTDMCLDHIKGSRPQTLHDLFIQSGIERPRSFLSESGSVFGRDQSSPVRTFSTWEHLSLPGLFCDSESPFSIGKPLFAASSFYPSSAIGSDPSFIYDSFSGSGPYFNSDSSPNSGSTSDSGLSFSPSSSLRSKSFSSSSRFSANQGPSFDHPAFDSVPENIKEKWEGSVQQSIVTGPAAVIQTSVVIGAGTILSTAATGGITLILGACGSVAISFNLLHPVGQIGAAIIVGGVLGGMLWDYCTRYASI